MAKLLHLSRPSKRVGNTVRTWWAMRSQKRRRRAVGACLVAPTNLQGEFYNEDARLFWEMTSVEGEDGCVVESRPAWEPAGAWSAPVLFSGPDATEGIVTAPGTGLWEFRIRAQAGTRYSEYSNVAQVQMRPGMPVIGSYSFEASGSPGVYDVVLNFSLGPDATGSQVELNFKRLPSGSNEWSEWIYVASVPGSDGTYRHVAAFNTGDMLHYGLQCSVGGITGGLAETDVVMD